MEKKKKPIGVVILSVAGIVTGLFSLLLGLIGEGPFSIVFGSAWIILGFRLLKLQNWARRTILVASPIFLLVYLLAFYAAMTVDRFFYIGLIMKSPLALLNVVAMVYLLRPKVKKVFLQQS